MNNTEPIFNHNGKPIGRIQNGNLVWTCDQYRCTWENNPNSIVAAVTKKKKLRYDKSVSQFYGGLG